jgi:hypothetical protein
MMGIRHKMHGPESNILCLTFLRCYQKPVVLRCVTTYANGRGELKS